ncbi:MAG: hypothetical protein DWQ37_13360 [Planctomycetota bacterium]|nr:MAG: hypothetical protein DWQ37_13360 [Planctomycetota bacterium]
MRRQACLLLTIFLGLSSTALGLGGTLLHPLIGYPSDIDPASMQQADDALRFMKEKLTFLDGHFVNQFAYNRFGGSAPDTSQFVTLLKEAEAWNVRVAFRDFGEQDSAFSLTQVMTTHEVVVTINSGRDDFRLKDFQPHLSQLGATGATGAASK